jgi:transposase InsO family protein
VIRFDNLLVKKVVRRINQVWMSDITYYELGNRFYYLTFIIDAYSRMIVGYSVSRTLLTEDTTLVALAMAVSTRSLKPGLILHSDGGGQYYCIAFLAETKACRIRNSMCWEAWQNPYAERVNGIIKNEYLVGYAPVDENDLRKKTMKAVRMYNTERPHGSIRDMSPTAFELSGLVIPVEMKLEEGVPRNRRPGARNA